MIKVAIYARVSTDRQDPDRQVRELESFVEREYPDADLERYVDIISGTTQGGGQEYQRLRQDIATGELGTVIVHELSRLSRLGGGEIHNLFNTRSSTTRLSATWKLASLSMSTTM